MDIVIAGAGSVGFHIASILSQDKHNVFLIDQDPKKLAEASLQLDIATHVGSATDWQLLETLLESEPAVFAALTNQDEVNLVSCSIAKQLGYPRTIARLQNDKYLNRTRMDFARMFGADHFVEPELLVASDVMKYILLPGSTAVESFAHGAVQLRTILVPEHWKGGHQPLAKLRLPDGIMVGLIRRFNPEQARGKHLAYQVIIPHGGDVILPGDEVTFIGETDVIFEIPQFFGIPQRKVRSVVIIGGLSTGAQLASILVEHGIKVRLIEMDYDVCCRLAAALPDCSILHHDPTDLAFLTSERIGHADLCVTCTNSDERNILTALLVKEVGCVDVVAMISTESYVQLTKQLKLPYVFSPRASAANRILSLILSQRITSIVSLYDNQVEIMEIQVSSDSPVIGIPLAELGPMMPKDFLIAMIQNRGRIMIANGSRIISPGDTVIAISTSKHAKDLERLF